MNTNWHGFCYLPKKIFSLGLNGNEAFVLLYLISLTGCESVYPSRQTIGQKCGIKSLKTVDNVIKSLIKKELLTYTKRAPLVSNTYKVNLTKIDETYQDYLTPTGKLDEPKLLGLINQMELDNILKCAYRKIS